jgi:hypothetical protein
MKFIKLFENFNDIDSDFGISELYYSNATISLSIGRGKDVTDVNLVNQMIEDYKVMYVKNNEWGGGPTNREWIKKYHNDFGLTEDRAYQAYKPNVMLNVNANGFGIMKFGFSIINKKCVSFNWGDSGKKMDCENCNGTGLVGQVVCRRCKGTRKVINPEYESSNIELIKYARNIYMEHLTFDEVILKLQLEVENDFDFIPLEN